MKSIWSAGVLLFASWVAQLLFEGVVLSFDLLLPNWLHYFKCSTTQVAVLAALVQGSSSILGPVSGWATNQFGSRAIIMLCGAACSCLFMIGSFASSYWQLAITCFLIGCSLGLAGVASVTSISFSHSNHRWRSLSTTLATTGGAVGAAIFPFIIETILDTDPWQTVFAILSLILAQAIVCGAFFPNKLSDTDHEISDFEPVGLDPQLALETKARAASIYSLVSVHMYEETLVHFTADTVSVTEIEGQKSSSEDLARRHRICACLLISSFLWALSCYMFDLLALKLDMEGYSGQAIAALFTIQAVCIVVGRGIATLLVAARYTKVVLWCSLALLTQGLFGLPIAWTQPLWVYALCVSVHASAYGAATALSASTVCHLVGLSKLNTIFGLKLCVEGAAGFLGAPLAGWIVDLGEDDYFTVYIVASLLSCLATALLLPFVNMNLVAQHTNRENLSEQNDQNSTNLNELPAENGTAKHEVLKLL